MPGHKALLLRVGIDRGTGGALAPFAPFRSLAAYYLAVHARLFPQRRFAAKPIEEAAS